MEMSAACLKQICKEHKLYTTPSLNDVLYANYKGFGEIANLEPYSGLKALFLEGNALDSLAGLPVLGDLKCLCAPALGCQPQSCRLGRPEAAWRARRYVQANMLSSLEGLEAQAALDTLNVSGNRLKRLENLAGCASLHTLLASGNELETLEDVQHLAECPQLSTVDLQDNKLADPKASSSQLHPWLAAAPGRTAARPGWARPLLLAERQARCQLWAGKRQPCRPASWQSAAGQPAAMATAWWHACTAQQAAACPCRTEADPPHLAQVLDLLKQLPDLRCLYLKGNPLVTATRHYRKVVIAAIPTLTYLDDRPVFDFERRCAEAWSAPAGAWACASLTPCSPAVGAATSSHSTTAACPPPPCTPENAVPSMGCSQPPVAAQGSWRAGRGEGAARRAGRRAAAAGAAGL